MQRRKFSREFTWTRMLRFETSEPGMADAALDRMRAEVEASPKGRRPRILLAYDGERISAYDTSPRFDEEPLRVGLDMLSLEGDIFFPLGGHERYVPKKERMADVRATRFISRFHDAVRDANPAWTREADRHALNIFMARVLFCLFSDDVGIFEKDVFETAVRLSNVDGSDLSEFLQNAFDHMDTPPERRSSETRPWSRLKFVNGSLFEEDVAMPALDGRSRKLLLDCAGLNWKLINPDIFGSMLQAVVDVEKRGELPGRHPGERRPVSAASFGAVQAGELAVVTGGASGIGLAAARAFAARDMRVAMVDRPGAALDASAEAVKGENVFAYPADVSDAAAMKRLAEELREECPSVLRPATSSRRSFDHGPFRASATGA